MSDPRPRVLSERCSSCVFRPGNLMHLQPGRLADLTATNRERGTLLICHQTLDHDGDADTAEAVCRGYWDAYGADSSVTQVMGRLFGPDWYREVPPPESH